MIVAPTFNNAKTLGDVISRCLATGLPIIVLNDGSTDETSDILAGLGESPHLKVLTHATNRGKAAALHSGFEAALKGEFTHAISIDTDGQHDPEQIAQLASIARDQPRALVLGVRDPKTAGYPARSRLGRAVSNFMIWLESGLKVNDSQCGLRVYPLDLVRAVNCMATRYGFETEILTRAAWAGWPVVQTPITCRYFVAEHRVSHFRPVGDSLKSIAMHARLVRGAMGRWARYIGWWLSPLRAWREIRGDERARQQFAVGLALGVFIACLPLYCFQSLLSLYAARRLNLHPLSVLAGSQISIPPFNAVLIFFSVAIGHFLLHGHLPEWVGWAALRSSATWSLHPIALFRDLALECTIGGLLLGVVLSLATYVLFKGLCRNVAADRSPRRHRIAGPAITPQPSEKQAAGGVGQNCG